MIPQLSTYFQQEALWAYPCTMRQEIISNLSPDYPWTDRFHFLPETGSTNLLLDKMAKEGAPHGTVVMADRQTDGRGRMGRSFLSPGGVGVYMSILLRPVCGPQQLMHLTCAAAVAMCDAVEAATGYRPGIKWTNDLVINRRKIAGILTKLALSASGTIDYAIVGIGINCCQELADFPESLQATAGSLHTALNAPISRPQVAAAMMESLWHMDQDLLSSQGEMLRQYRADCITIGQDISLVRGSEIRHGKALDVDSSGALVVQFSDGSIQAVSSGEVSVRGMYGYV